MDVLNTPFNGHVVRPVHYMSPAAFEMVLLYIAYLVSFNEARKMVIPRPVEWRSTSWRCIYEIKPLMTVRDSRVSSFRTIR